jgi:hypothetical protein
MPGRRPVYRQGGARLAWPRPGIGLTGNAMAGPPPSYVERGGRRVSGDRGSALADPNRAGPAHRRLPRTTA